MGKIFGKKNQDQVWLAGLLHNLDPISSAIWQFAALGRASLTLLVFARLASREQRNIAWRCASLTLLCCSNVLLHICDCFPSRRFWTLVVCWLDSREFLQNKELNKRNIGWKTPLLFTNIPSIPAYSWSVARQRRVTKMAVIKVIKFNVKFNVSEIVDKGMQLHIDKGQKAENCRRGNKVRKPRRCFFVLSAPWLVTVSRLIRRHIVQLFNHRFWHQLWASAHNLTAVLLILLLAFAFYYDWFFSSKLDKYILTLYFCKSTLEKVTSSLQCIEDNEKCWRALGLNEVRG